MSSSSHILMFIQLFAASTFTFLHAFPLIEDGYYDLTENNNATIPKIPKCCPMGEALLDPKSGCLKSDLTFEPLFTGRVPDQVDIIIGFKCDYKKYRLEPEESSEDEFHLLYDGSLSVPFQEPSLLSPLEYCMENTLVHDEAQILPFLCFPPPTNTQQSWRRLSYIIFPIGCLISVPFLAVVVFLYFGIRELRTTHGKVLACHSACLAVAYFSLSMVQLMGEQLPHPLCVTMAFIIQFSFMSCFFWLNLLCLHTWRQLNKGYTSREGNTIGDKVMFLLYSLYGWGVPIVIICVSVVMDLTPAIPSTYLKPNFGLDSCWFHNDNAALPYFYGPIALLLVINVFFFILTARIVHKNGPTIVERITTLEQAVKSVIVQKRKQSFVQAILLFLAMGLNWLLEVISWAVGGPLHLWLLTDIVNTLQGVTVFYIFVIRDPWVRRLGMQYFWRICCCREDTTTVTPEEEEVGEVLVNNEGLVKIVQHNGTEKKRTFQQMVPLVSMKNKETV